MGALMNNGAEEMRTENFEGRTRTSKCADMLNS